MDDDEPPQLCIKAGRHPMLDAQLAGGSVPNDLQLAWAGQRAAIVTGPNMGGKSCLIRQAALLVIMAQVGAGSAGRAACSHAALRFVAGSRQQAGAPTTDHRRHAVATS